MFQDLKRKTIATTEADHVEEDLSELMLLHPYLHSEFVSIDEDLRTVRYTGPAAHGGDVGVALASKPIVPNDSIFYFEVQILDLGTKGEISVGLGTSKMNLQRHPGIDKNSYAVRADSGNVFHSSSCGKSYFTPCETSDVIGCGVNFEKQEIFFSKNGKQFGAAFPDPLMCSKTYYPVVGLHGDSEKIIANFGQEPFAFNVDDYKTKLATQKVNEVAGIEVPELDEKGILGVIRQYLVYNGYQKTLAAVHNDLVPNVESIASSSSDKSVSNTNTDEAQNQEKAENNPKNTQSIESDGTNSEILKADESDAANLKISEADIVVNAPDMNHSDDAFGIKDYMMATLTQRARIRVLILGGHSLEAAEVLADRYANRSKSAKASMGEAMFALHCQHVVELIREGQVTEAVIFARDHIAEIFKHREELQKALSLLCYVNPAGSPFAHLLEEEERRRVAYRVNQCVLLWHSLAGTQKGESMSLRASQCMSTIEKIRCQLVNTRVLYYQRVFGNTNLSLTSFVGSTQENERLRHKVSKEENCLSAGLNT